MGFQLLVDSTEQHGGACLCFLKSPHGEGGGGCWMGCMEPGAKYLGGEYGLELTRGWKGEPGVLSLAFIYTHSAQEHKLLVQSTDLCIKVALWID